MTTVMPKRSRRRCSDRHAIVPIKSEEQLDVQAVHRVRERLLAQRTSLVNQLRAFFLERGLMVRTGRAYLWRALPEVLARAEETVSRACFG